MRGLPVAPTSAVGGKKLFSVPSVRCVNRNLLRSPSPDHRRPDVAARELHAFQTLLSPQFHVVDGLGSGGVQSPLLFRRRPALARLGCTHGSRRQRVCLPRRPDAVVGSGRREGKERPAPSGNTMLCSATARAANLLLAPTSPPVPSGSQVGQGKGAALPPWALPPVTCLPVRTI